MTATRIIATVTAGLALALLPATSAGAADAPYAGSDFGDHVTACATTMGLDAMHNPGMHDGITDWEDMHSSMP